MTKNSLVVQINKSVSKVFSFTIDPKNTPKWIDSIIVEETGDWPVKPGSIYRNQGATGEWSEYVVTAYESNKVFELTNKDNTYHVRYTYSAIDENTTELEYCEWMDLGELETPLSQETLDKLAILVK